MTSYKKLKQFKTKKVVVEEMPPDLTAHIPKARDMAKVRYEVIKTHYPKHLYHQLIMIDTRYDGEEFESEVMECECGEKLVMTKEIIEEDNRWMRN